MMASYGTFGDKAMLVNTQSQSDQHRDTQQEQVQVDQVKVEVEKASDVVNGANRRLTDWLFIVQIIVSVLDMVAAAFVFMPLATLYKMFGGSCVLYANITLQNVSDAASNDSDWVRVVLKTSVYGSEWDCNYTTYINVCLFCTCVMFVAFFLIAIADLEDEKHLSQAHILVPAWVIKLVFLVCVLLASLKIAGGKSSFCSFLEENSQVEGEGNSSIPCYEYENYQWTLGNVKNFWLYLEIAEIASWVLTGLLASEVLYTGFHLYKDFNMQVESGHLGKVEALTREGSISIRGGSSNKGLKRSDSSSYQSFKSDHEKTDLGGAERPKALRRRVKDSDNALTQSQSTGPSSDWFTASEGPAEVTGGRREVITPSLDGNEDLELSYMDEGRVGKVDGGEHSMEGGTDLLGIGREKVVSGDRDGQVEITGGQGDSGQEKMTGGQGVSDQVVVVDVHPPMATSQVDDTSVKS